MRGTALGRCESSICPDVEINCSRRGRKKKLYFCLFCVCGWPWPWPAAHSWERGEKQQGWAMGRLEAALTQGPNFLLHVAFTPQYLFLLAPGILNFRQRGGIRGGIARPWGACGLSQLPGLRYLRRTTSRKSARGLHSHPLIPIPVKPEELNLSFNPFIVSQDKINFTQELCKAN